MASILSESACVHMCRCILHARMYGSQRTMSGIVSWSFIDWPDWLASKLWELTYLHSHSPGITSVHRRPVSSTLVLGVKLRSTIFQGNHFTYGVISPCPRQISVYCWQCLSESQGQAHRLRLVIRLNYSATSPQFSNLVSGSVTDIHSSEWSGMHS